MTAIVVVGILLIIGFMFTIAGIGYLKQFRVKDVESENFRLKGELRSHQDFVEELCNAAYDYGYPADPLASVVVGRVREFKKENK